MVFLGFAGAVGGLIGLYWSVLALLPATAGMLFVWCALAWVPGDYNLPSIILGAVSLQSGYMIGLTGRDVVGAVISWVHTAPSKRF
jgi:hypothetical protein